MRGFWSSPLLFNRRRSRARILWRERSNSKRGRLNGIAALPGKIPENDDENVKELEFTRDPNDQRRFGNSFLGAVNSFSQNR